MFIHNEYVHKCQKNFRNGKQNIPIHVVVGYVSQ